MDNLLNSPIVSNKLLLVKSFESNSTRRDRSMNSRHRCPCCSDILLRHMRSGGLYWRCSHCHDDMPVL
jgi:ribosomal protein L37AE/L43A